MKFDLLFYLAQPLRDFLFERCDPKDFCTLLCASKTVYASFRRSGSSISAHKLQLSDVFWNRYVLDSTVSESEFRAYVKTLYDSMAYNGERFSLFSPDWHAPAVQRRVSIDLEAWMAVYVKFYDAPWLTARREAVLDRGFVPIGDEANEDDTIADAIDWIVSELQSEKVFVDGRTNFINRQLHKFVFWSRVARFAEPHVDWLRTERRTDVASLYKEYMLRVGFDQRI